MARLYDLRWWVGDEDIIDVLLLNMKENSGRIDAR